MSAKSKQRTAKVIRWTARIIGLTVTLFFLMFLIGETVMAVREEGLAGIKVEGFFVAAPIIIAVAGCTISWWNEAVAGSVLILAYLLAGFSRALVSLYFGMGFQLSEVLAHSPWWIITLPFLVAGVLFLISWRLLRKTR